MNIPQKVEKWIRQEHLIQQGDRIIAAVSGGADSVCLLLCLHALSGSFSFQLSAVHIHHGIRGEEADGDAAFCEALCRELGVPFRLFCEDVPALAEQEKRSLEEAGRIVRYRDLREEAARLAGEEPQRRVRIAVAHHQDDQAETVLMNLCRGTGIRGLGGMPSEQGDIIRPLLSLRRAEIEAWLAEQGQPWRQDATNLEDENTRNRIRHHLIPWLTEQVNPRSVEHIQALAVQAQELDDYLEQEAEKWLTGVCGVQTDRREEEAAENSAGGKKIFLPAAELAVLPEALKGRILLRAMGRAAGGSRDLTARHVAAVRDLLEGPAGRRLSLPGGVTARRDYRDLILEAADSEDGEQETSQLPPAADFSVLVWTGREKIPEKRYTKWFDCDKINGDVFFRHRHPGDTIELKGVGKKTVKSYMIDAKIPAERRDSLWLLTDGEQILWIVGYRMSAACQVTSETRRILQVSVPEGT